MKRNVGKRVLAFVLSGALVLGVMHAPMNVEAGKTLYGAPKTIDAKQNVLVRENNFNKDWKFYLGTNGSAQNKDFDDSSWKNVNLPHDFSISQNFTSSGEAESGFLPGGTGWYRKSFTMPQTAEGQTILLNFDGVYSDAYVYVNGESVGEHHYGYTSFAFDISDKLICDGATENVIAVQAVNNVPTSRWYSGSGIYRDVTLIVADTVHVDLNGTKVTTPNIANDDGTVNVAVEVVNDGTTAKTVSVTNTIYKKGETTALANGTASVTVNAASKSTAALNLKVNNPALWSVENPNLYTVVTELSVDGTVTDTYETNFGFRWFSFDGSGFHLNGENVKLNGVCMHHDQGALGSAAYYDAMYRQLSIMKEMGCNAIRTAHNPADEQFIEICSEIGLLVIEETFDGLVDPKNSNSNDFSKYFESAIHTNLYGAENGMTCAEFAAKAHVKRDRNEPCIIAWSFGNEIQEGTVGWESGRTSVARYDDICAEYITWVNSLDGTRPVTSGDNNRGGNEHLVNVINTITAAGGVAGFNYANSASLLYNLAQNYGGTNKVIIASETSSATNSRSRYQSQNNNDAVDGAYHLTSYDTSSVGWGITAHDSIYNTYQYDCVAGEFVWTGFDYIGEPTPWNGTGSGDSGRGAIPNSSYFGIVETTGFEKDTYYLYRSQWNKEKTTVHLVTAWDADNQYVTDGKTPVWLYSNAPKVKLYLNDQWIATATRDEVVSNANHTYYTYTSESKNTNVCTVSNGSGADALYSVFNVAYTQGTLRAEAYDEDDKWIDLDASCGQYTVTTPGTVTKLAAAVNKTEIAADGSSLAYVEVDVLDANGNLDTTASNNITFTLSGAGEIVGVDNGDQATTAKYQQSSVLTNSTSAKINAYAGKALVIVRSTEEDGEITVTAQANGLASATAEIRTIPATADNVTDNGLESYTMVKDYTIKEGTVPTLDTSSTGTFADGTTAEGVITWDAVPENVYGTAGDYTMNGTLAFNGLETIPVSAKLHVIANVIDLRNISTATIVGTAPKLPDTVSGVLANGTLAGEFNVTWNIPSESEYDVAGEIVTVTGTAVIFDDETMDVTCSVRVAEAVNTESINVAPQADSLTQDIASGYQSDVLSSITNGTLKPGDNTSERWTNWKNRTRSADATLTLTWATAQMLSGVNLYYYYDNCAAYPESLEFSYSLNGQEYTVIGHTAEQIETYSLGAKYSYTFEHPINPVGLKVKLTQQNGTSGSSCVGLTELEVMTYAAELEYNSSSDLSNITVDGTGVTGFAADQLTYEMDGDSVAAATSVNAGITVLPPYEGIVRILTIAEDGTSTKTYEVMTGAEAECQHAWDQGTVTKAPTTEETGIKTYTCTVCKTTKEEILSKVTAAIPVALVSATTTAEGQITVTGQFADYENSADYTLVTNHGILFYETARLGSEALTINTEGRTLVDFTDYFDDGTFRYHKTPVTESMKYTVRSFLEYVDTSGNTKYVYSEPLIVAYDLLRADEIEVLLKNLVNEGAADETVLTELQTQLGMTAEEAQARWEAFLYLPGNAYGTFILECINAGKTEEDKADIINAMIEKFGLPEGEEAKENTFYITAVAAEKYVTLYFEKFYKE